MKLLFVVIQRLTYALAWYGGVEKYRKIVKIGRAMFHTTFFDRLLMSAGLEKDKHKANFATFMNVIVSQRYNLLILLLCL